MVERALSPALSRKRERGNAAPDVVSGAGGGSLSCVPGEGRGGVFRRSEAGYNLVILMVAMTLLNILLALALPKWSHVIRREREEELISRGFQYAEAIRLFNKNHLRPPVRLEELVELEPRSIRKLWKDPMTENGRWVLIPLQGGPGGQPLTPQPTGPDGKPLPGDDDDGQEDSDDPPEPDDDMEIDPDTGIGDKKGVQQIGPFSGVHSRSGDESILVFNGRTRYDEWHFTMEMIQALLGGNQSGLGGDPGRGNAFSSGDPTRIPSFSTRWLGRPLPEFLTAPQMQDGQMPDGRTPPKPSIRR